MASDDDKKWYKDKEKLVPGFIGAAVRLSSDRFLFLLAKKKRDPYLI